MKKYFGTDGIRGEVNRVLTAEFALKVGKALCLLKEQKIFIGYDTRLSNKMLLSSIAAGAMSQGIHIIDLGMISTPGICLFTLLNQTSGVMITASHNPFTDNGIKIFKDGFKISDELEEKMEELIDLNVSEFTPTVGTWMTLDHGKVSYMTFLEEKIMPYNMSIGIDCANGATSEIAFSVFNKVSKQAYFINRDYNGLNINLNCGATHMNAISDFVQKEHLDIGFSFDGDGDRLLVVDSKGRLISGDEIIYVFACYLKKQNRLKNNTVVLTKMSNLGILNALYDNQIDVVLTDVGDKNVLDEMLKNDYSLGGENSGHIIFDDFLKTGDGILSALYLLRILKEENKSLDELLTNVEIYPEKTVNIKVLDKKIARDEKLVTHVCEMEKKLGSTGKIILRASGTENLIRVTVCAKDSEILESTLHFLVDEVHKLNQ